jgi:hypothetical protein
MSESRVEYFGVSPRQTPVEALRSLAAHAGLPIDHVAALAAQNRLSELFDVVETRSLAYKDGKRLSPRELRIMATKRDPKVALVELEARRPSRIDGRVALRQMLAKRTVTHED